MYRIQVASDRAELSINFQLLLEFILIRHQKIQQPIGVFLEVAPDGNRTLAKLPPGFRLRRAAIPGGTQVFLKIVIIKVKIIVHVCLASPFVIIELYLRKLKILKTFFIQFNYQFFISTFNFSILNNSLKVLFCCLNYYFYFAIL